MKTTHFFAKWVRYISLTPTNSLNFKSSDITQTPNHQPFQTKPGNWAVVCVCVSLRRKWQSNPTAHFFFFSFFGFPQCFLKTFIIIQFQTFQNNIKFRLLSTFFALIRTCNNKFIATQYFHNYLHELLELAIHKKITILFIFFEIERANLTVNHLFPRHNSVQSTT